MTERFDYAVVGLGALGSATAYQLAKRGHRVLGLEQFELGHARGASHDTSRILRHSYHTPGYVRLTCEAYADWARLEADTGESLVTVVGGLDLFPAGGVIPLDDYTGSLDEIGIDFELIDAAEVMGRWPQFRLRSDVVGLFQERGAIVPAGRTTTLLQARAQALGATLRDRAPVSGLQPLVGGGIEVAVGADRYLCSGVVVCADAWADRLLSDLGVRLPLTVTAEQVTYFAPPDPTAYAPGRLPLWIWMDEPCFYGFPTYGEATIKAAQDCGGPVVDPGDRPFDSDLDMQSRLEAHLTAILPGSGPPIRSLRCLYALTPDRDFVLAAVPGLPAVVVGLGAGHGMKFAPTFGRLLADLVTTGECDVDVSPFRLDRPGLTDPGYQPHWMI